MVFLVCQDGTLTHKRKAHTMNAQDSISLVESISCELDQFIAVSRTCEGETFALASCVNELACAAGNATAMRMFAIAAGSILDPKDWGDDAKTVLADLAQECANLVDAIALYMSGRTHRAGVSLADSIEVLMDSVADLASEATE
jgi:hypothetical protein